MKTLKTKKSILVLLVLILAGSLTAQVVSKDSPLATVYYKKATFAGGCFWCMEPPFEALDGVIEVVSGYTGGSVEHPTYQQVTSGLTGHLEVVQVLYDPQKVSYNTLLETFWKNIDPTDGGGQFADRGSQYNTAIFYHTEAQREAAEKSRAALNKTGKFKQEVATKIRGAERFYPAEDYHQDFYLKKPSYYNRYKKGSGREAYIKKTWEKD